nr:hypothetical protein [Rubellimicrobium aerolatum]
MGWYDPSVGAGLIDATIGAILVLIIRGAVTRRT